MTIRLLALFASAALCLTAAAQEPVTTKLHLRAVLHDPLRSQLDLYVHDASKGIVPLNLSLEGLTEPQTVSVIDGTLQLFDSETIDPEKPLVHLAAKVAIPPKLSRAIVLIIPSGRETGPAYRMMVLNDDPKVFRKAETRVLNLTKLSLAMKAGEHSLKLSPAKVTAVPRVTKLNDLNQAQTSFYQKGEGENEWVLIAERPMQFADGARNIILIYQMPKAKAPQLRTLIDTDWAE
jgi:hypothetical protein